MSRGENQSVVLYWYQGHGRVIASEYEAKIYTVLDSLRYKRSDTSLIRVVQGVAGGNTRQATDNAVSFVKAFFQPLREYLPGCRPPAQEKRRKLSKNRPKKPEPSRLSRGRLPGWVQARRLPALYAIGLKFVDCFK